MARAPRRAKAPRRRAPRRRNIPDSQQLAGIKQGVGRSVVRAFGATLARRRRRGRRGAKGMNFSCCHHDAFHMSHLPLPRPTGPYVVIRTTEVVTSSAPLMIFGPTWDPAEARWTNLMCYGALDENKTWATAGNVYQYTFQSMKNNSWLAAQVTPAAFSVQCMNPNALQTTSGIVYGGRVRTAWKIKEHGGETPKATANQFISYNNPRLMAAAKLAFRGVQVDCVPFNMSRVADFTTQHDTDPGATAIGSGTWEYSGFNPSFFYNPAGINLQYLVCCEWRVRFDPTNPAQASHIQYPNAPESMWMQMLHAAEAAGNGVIDIADKVAQTGNAVFGAMGSSYRAARGMRAIGSAVPALALT